MSSNNDDNEHDSSDHRSSRKDRITQRLRASLTEEQERHRRRQQESRGRSDDDDDDDDVAPSSSTDSVRAGSTAAAASPAPVVDADHRFTAPMAAASTITFATTAATRAGTATTRPPTRPDRVDPPPRNTTPAHVRVDGRADADTDEPEFDQIEEKLRGRRPSRPTTTTTITPYNNNNINTNNRNNSNNDDDEGVLLTASVREFDPCDYDPRDFETPGAAFVVEEPEGDVVSGLVVDDAFDCEQQERLRQTNRLACRVLIRRAILAFAVTVVIIAPVAVFVARRNRGGTRSPTAAPTSFPSASLSSPPTSARFQTLSKRLASVVSSNSGDGDDPWSDPTSARYRALRWLAYEDLGTDVDAVNLVQRYVLAVLYHSTNGDEWILCAKGSGCKVRLCYTGVVSCNSVKEDDQPWLSPANECDWYQLRCNDQGFVTHIRFENYSNGLVGTIPDELRHLTNLTWLGLANNCNAISVAAADATGRYDNFINQLSGTIPDFLGTDLPHIELLWLSHNHFSGPVPDSLWSLTALRVLRLDGNRLTGALSPDVAALAQLQTANFSDNALSGELPDAVGTLTRLDVLNLHANNFNGTVPESVCSRVDDSALTLSIDCSEVQCDCCDERC